jgi:hypothetical protein
MAVEGIAIHVQNTADQLFGQKPVKQPGTNTLILGTGRASHGTVTEDTFTPSGQNNSERATAQDAGIFHVSQVALKDVTANIVFEQATPNTNQNGAPAPAAPSTTTNAGAPVEAGQQVAGNPTAPAAPGAAASANVQIQIQALNAALPALGLTTAEIQQIDRLASQAHNFNPAAYVNLVNQFEALSQQAAQQSTTIAPANANTNAPINAGTNAKGAGLQAREILIHSTGVQGRGNSAPALDSGQGSTANNVRINAATSQIEQVQSNLSNNNGQPIQVHAPHQITTAGTANQQTPKNEAAAA